MAKITLTTVTNGQDISNINANFSAIATALNNNVLYRVNIGSEPNTPAQDLDFNGNKIYNLSDVLVNGVSVLTLTQTASDATGTATAAALAAQASATAASASAVSAAASVSNALTKSGNLSDLASIPTAKTNLGLQNVSNTSDANKPVSTAQQAALDLKANLNSPVFTGNVGVPNRVAGDASANAANTAFVYGTIAAPQIGIGSSTAVPGTSAFTNIRAAGQVRVFASSSSITIPAATQQTIGNWTNAVNQGTGWNGLTGVFTVPRTGFYRIKLRWTTSTLITTSGTQMAAIILVNGVSNYNIGYSGSQSVSGLQQGPEVSAIVSLTVGQTLSGQAFCAQSVVLSGSNSTYLEIEEMI